MVAQFCHVAFVNLQVRGILHPNVNTESPLTAALQGRAINAIGRPVVLPCNIIYALRIHLSCDKNLWLLRSPFRNGKLSSATGAHRCLDKYLPVVTQLISSLLVKGILHHKGFPLSQSHFLTHGLGIKLNEFLPLHILGIRYLHFHIGCLAEQGQHEQSCQRKQFVHSVDGYLFIPNTYFNSLSKKFTI